MNNIKPLSENDFATLLLCSDMACDKKTKAIFRFYLFKICLALFKSGYQPSDLFIMKPSKILEITQAQNLFLQELKIWISLTGFLY